MKKARRSFLKKAAVASALTAVGTVAATAAGTKSSTYSSDGVVVGKSNKKEILYKKTEAWDEYYRSAV